MASSMINGWLPLARGIYLEGLACDDSRATVWFSDVVAGGVHGLRADGSTVVLDSDRMWTGGIAIDEAGRILSSGAGGIRWNDPDRGSSGWLLDTIDGAPVNGINEMVADAQGGLYFGTVDIENVAKGETPRPAAIFRLHGAGEAIAVADGLGFANGMMLSGDGSRLFYNDTFDGIYVFEVRGDGRCRSAAGCWTRQIATAWRSMPRGCCG